MSRVLVSMGLVLSAVTAYAADVDMAQVARERGAFVDRMVAEHGFDRKALEATLSEAKIEDRVLDAMSRPAERVLTWREYRPIFVNPQRIGKGVAFWRAHGKTISDIAERYRVPPEMLVAIIGVETLFGERTGSYRVIDSLSTLAFAYPPRAAFFSSELENFLLLSREEALDPLSPLGSYAGAMGAGQFIPSSYRAYAVDADGDGRRDLWQSWADVLGSVANYFDAHGWQHGEPVVEQATLGSRWSGSKPDNRLDFDETVGGLTRQGYVFESELPDESRAAVFALEGESGTEYWIGYRNFEVITRYNRSAMYALAAYQLGQAIATRYASLQASADGQ